MTIIIGIQSPSFDDYSIIKSLNYGKDINANIIQIYAGNKIKTTLNYKIKLNKKYSNDVLNFMKKNNMKIVIHSILRLNFCYPVGSKRFAWGLDNLIYDMKLGQKINSYGTVLHLGIKKNKFEELTEEQCINNYTDSIRYVLNKTPKKSRIFIEFCANEKNKIAGTIERFSKLYNNFSLIEKKRVGICIDTQHIFAAGYPINTVEGVNNFFNEFNEKIGLKNIKIFHINDSCTELGSRIDRHAGIGDGYIFDETKGGSKASLNELIFIITQLKVPAILETKHVNECKKGNFKKEIKMIKRISTETPKKKIIKGGKLDKKKEIIDNFKKISDYYRNIGKSNRTLLFKSFQYNKAIKSLDKYEGNIENLKNLQKLNGIGKSLINKIDHILKNKNLNIIKKINDNPDIKNKKELVKIIGVGPIIAQKFVNQKIRSINDLENHHKKGKIKLTKMQLLGLKYYKDLEKKIPRDEILYFKNIIQRILNKEFNDIHVCLAGSFRTGKNFSKDIDLIIYINKLKSKKDLLKSNIFIKILNLLEKENIIYDKLDNKKNSALTIAKLPSKYKKFSPHIFRQIDIRLVPKDTFHFYMLYFGSGLIFSRKIRAIAKKKGLKLTQDGLFDKDNKFITGLNNEKDIFDFLDLDFVDPKNR